MRGAFVLDASATLAFLNDEPGRAYVQSALQLSCVMSSVNLAEVISKLRERGTDEMEVDRRIGRFLALGCKVAAFGHDLAALTGHLRPETRSFGLSLGDRACLALSLQINRPVLTTEHQWEQLDRHKFSIVLIR